MKKDIEAFVRRLGSADIKVLEGDYTGGMYLQQVPDEITSCIVELIKGDYHLKNYLEIGVASGGTTFLFNYFFDWDNILIIDDNKHRHKHYRFRQKILKHVKYKEFIGDSHTKEAYDFAKRFSFDLIFIDGDHSYEGVKKDIETYLCLLNLGGFVLLHDTLFCAGVKQMLEEMKTNKFFKFINEYISKTPRKLGLGLLQRVG